MGKHAQILPDVNDCTAPQQQCKAVPLVFPWTHPQDARRRAMLEITFFQLMAEGNQSDRIWPTSILL